MSVQGKKIGIIAREPSSEALRMALGLTTLAHDVIVFICGHEVKADEMTSQHVEALELMDVRLVTNHSSNTFEQVSVNEASRLMAGCEIVIPC